MFELLAGGVEAGAVKFEPRGVFGVEVYALAVVHVDANGIIEPFKHNSVAVDAVVHLAVVNIARKSDGLYLRVLLVFVVELEVGLGFGGE